jgi:hypothetical protein
MPHDRQKAAIRARMATTGEPYSVARRAVLKGEPEVRWFDLRYDSKGLDWITRLLDPIVSRGRPSGVSLAREELRVRAAEFEQRIPRARITGARAIEVDLHGTSGVHVNRDGRLLVNGARSGLVELTLNPPCRTPRTLSTMFVRETVHSVVVSLVDPDGFLTALGISPDTPPQQPREAHR